MFEIQLLPPRAVGVADLGVAVTFLVSYGATRDAPALAREAGPTLQLFWAGKEKVGLFWWKATGRTAWQ